MALLDANGKELRVAGEVRLVDSADNLFKEGFGSVEMWDFSMSNMSQEAREKAVSKVASVCFGNDGTKVDGKKLYDKLYRESIGLPSSAFEFVPVFLSQEDYWLITDSMAQIMDKEPATFQAAHVEKYSYAIPFEEPSTIIGGDPKVSVRRLTNLRALVRDLSYLKKYFPDEERFVIENNFFNTDERELEFMYHMTKVFKMELDIPSARQLMRHRASWQELSRRYTDGDKVPIRVYLDSDVTNSDAKVTVGEEVFFAKDVVNLSVSMYEALLKDGVAKQDARRILPMGLMTKVWSSWGVEQLAEMVKLRTSAKTQNELRLMAKKIDELICQTMS